MADGRQLPVEDGDQPGLGRVEHDVLEPVVAVGDGHRVVGRDPPGQLLDQRLHLRDQLAFGAPVLFGPAADLAFEVAARPAVVAEAGGDEVDLVQPGEGGAQFVIDRRPFGGRQAWQGGVPEDAAFHVVHDIEAGADDRVVLAQRAHAGHGHVTLQRLHGPVLAIDLVGAGQQHAGRLLAQDIAQRPVRAVGGQQEGRVGGAALELLHAHGLAEALDAGLQPGFQRRGIEAMGRGDLANRR